ncbi:MAG: hypothetical protein ACKOE4_04490 [Candidatus Kapaibacterium sp.]
MNRFYRAGISAAIAIITLASAAIAQQANLNLEGIVRDSATGNPVGCKLHIYAPSGKRISITSNSKYGTYLQTLSEAGPHKIVIAGHNVYRKETSVDIPKSERFLTIKQDFLVREIVEGRLLSTTQKAFDHNMATFSADGRKAIDEVAELMRVNTTMNVVVTLSADEDRLASVRAAAQADYKKQFDAWTKAVKKLKKGQTPPAEPQMPPDPSDPNEQLIKDRQAAIVAVLKEVKMGDVRVSFVTKPLVSEAPPAAPVAETPAPAAGKKGAKAKPAAPAPTKAKSAMASGPNMVITIGKVRGLFD